MYCKSSKKPDDIPANPGRKYKNEWKGMGDWLDTSYIATYDRKYREFKEAREFVQKLKLKTGIHGKLTANPVRNLTIYRLLQT